MSLSEVSNILWRECRLVELLMFKFEEEQLVLASGRVRWLSDATREVETILEAIRCVELERALAVADAAVELGMPEPESLRALVATVPPPWDGIFADHRRALLRLAREIDAIAGSGRHPDTDSPMSRVGSDLSSGAQHRRRDDELVECRTASSDRPAAPVQIDVEDLATAAIQPSLAAFLQ